MRFRQTARRFLLFVTFAAAAFVPSALQAQEPHSRQQLALWFAESSPEVLALPGTVFADHDEDNNRLVVGVEHAAAIRGVTTALERLGIPSSAFSVQVTTPIHQLDSLRDPWRPTIAGIQVHFGDFVCTNGFNADDGTERSFVTCSHCTDRQGGVEDTEYFQPLSFIDPTVIATEVEDPRYFKGGECPRSRKCRFSDSARALYAPIVSSTRGAIAQTSGPNNFSLEVTGTFTITSQDDTTTSFPIGATLNKVGRTTGWTQGNVTQTCVHTNVSGSNITQLCQTFVQNPGGAVVVLGGDSGSGVFQVISGSEVQLVGILWGGSEDGTLFVFSPLKQVQDELGPLVTTP